MTILISISLLLIAINIALNGVDNRKIKKQIKDLADNQFDAEEVMKLYQMKYNAPRIRCETPNVIELQASYSLPYEYRNEVSEEEIYLQLTKDLTKDLGKYVDVVVDKDIVRMSTEYRARLRVVSK